MDEPDWTLEDHLRHGRSAICEIGDAPAEAISGPRLCFHLYPATSDDDQNWGMEAQYCQRAKHEFDACAPDFDVDYIGGQSGIVAWQYIVPTHDWLMRTIPLVWDTAKKANMSFVGWSFEPRTGPYIFVSSIVNAYNENNIRASPQFSRPHSVGRVSEWLRNRSSFPLSRMLKALRARLMPNTVRIFIGRRTQRREIAAVRASALFDGEWYLAKYPDVRSKNLDPARHYVQNGWRERRDPGPNFSTKRWLKANPGHDPAVSPLLQHLHSSELRATANRDRSD